MYRNSSVNSLSWILSSIGALNWGLKGLLGVDLVRSIFGEDSFATRLVYTFIGAAGAWSVYHLLSRSTTERARFSFGRFGMRV